MFLTFFVRYLPFSLSSLCTSFAPCLSPFIRSPLCGILTGPHAHPCSLVSTLSSCCARTWLLETYLLCVLLRSRSAPREEWGGGGIVAPTWISHHSVKHQPLAVQTGLPLVQSPILMNSGCVGTRQRDHPAKTKCFYLNKNPGFIPPHHIKPALI